MASLFTLRSLMALATKIGANPNKFMGTKNNISFLGKGPTKNPLFQNYLPGLEKASMPDVIYTSLFKGGPGSLIKATEDAMSYASAGKLNSIQTQILGKNMLNLDKIINPTLATVTKLPTQGSGIMGAKKTTAPTGFMGWTPRVVPKKVNIPASKLNHQMIAKQYNIDVELIKGKDWTEVLEVIKNLGLKHGGLASMTPRRGRVTHPGGYAGYRTATTDDYKNLFRNKGSTEDFRNLYKQGIKDIEEELLTNELIKILGGAMGGYKDGGLARILEV